MNITKRIDFFRNASHYYSIDILRGIAAVMVVVHHFVNGNPKRFSDFDFLQTFSAYGSFGVHIFFVISGFVIPNAMLNSQYKITNLGKFILKRLVRLEPPYLLSILICLGLIVLSLLNPRARGMAIPVSWEQIIFHLGYLNAFLKYDWLNPVYWTLAIEFQYYILIACVYPLIMKDNKYLNVALILVFYLLAWYFPQKELFFKYGPYFIFGIVLFMFKSNRLNGLGLLITLLINTLFCIYVESSFAVVFAVFAFAFIIYSNSKNSLGLYIGALSYSLYLLHVPIGQRILNLSENFVHNQYLMLLVVLICLVAIILISRVFYLLVEKPSQNLSKKIRL